MKSVAMAPPSTIINILLQFLGLGNMGQFSGYVLSPCGRVNTATLELNISPYCPPSHAIIYIYILGRVIFAHISLVVIFLCTAHAWNNEIDWEEEV